MFNESLYLNSRGVGLIILLDQSASIRAQSRSSINAFLSELKGGLTASFKQPEIISLCQIAYISHQVRWSPVVPIDQLEMSSVEIDSEPGSNLGLALRECGSKLSELMESLLKRGQIRLLKPTVLLVSDGWSTDNPDDGLNTFQHTYWGDRTFLRAVVSLQKDGEYCQRFLNLFSKNKIYYSNQPDPLINEILNSYIMNGDNNKW